MSERPHRRITYGYAVRYKPGTDLARRYPGIPRGRFRDAEEAERVRAACPNAEFMEVIDVREVRSVTRLERLRQMRELIDREIREEVERLAAMGGDQIIARCCALYGAEVEMVLKGSRRQESIRARQAAAWLLRRNGLSLPQIGRILGVDHTTALYACRKIDGSPATRALLLGLEEVA